MKDVLKKYFTNCWTIPNLLSLIRILLIPVFGVLFYRGEYGWAVLVLVISGLSDFFDGKIARKFNQISELGKMLDPIADKLTQITIAIIFYLTFSNSSDETVKAFSWVFLVFLFKEAIMIVAGVIMVMFGLVPCAAEMPGKIATFVFYFVMIAIVAFGPDVGMFKDFFTLPSTVMMILVAISVLLTIVAFFSYVPDVIRQIKEKKAKK